jgi:hypothetical protein
MSQLPSDEATARIEAAFHEAAVFPPGAEREGCLDRFCGADTTMRAEVVSLLAAHDAAGAFIEAPASPLTGDTGSPPALPGFELGQRLGAGALGDVYEAHDRTLSRTVAVKILRTGSNPARRERIVAEARRAAALNDPAIVTIHTVIDDPTSPAIVMERVDGYPIDTAVAALSFRQKAEILREICRALAHAHARGIVHRDLKPANVLVTPQLKPKVLDFGLAVLAGGIDAKHSPAGFEGTPLYASPEQAGGETVAPASDVFSFGSLMFTVLVGRPPFAGANADEVLRAIRTTPPPFPRDVAVGVPEDLQAICLACLSLAPGDRPAAAQLVVEFGRYLAGEPVRLRPALYADILRRRTSEHAQEVANWEHQGMISQVESDRLQEVHRRILAEEDHWIIDARRLTAAQTLLYTSTWTVVVMAFLLVWLARDDVSPTLRWVGPLASTVALLAVGVLAERRREALASASFLAAAILSIVPTSLELLAESRVLAVAPAGVTQLFGTVFTNQQLLVALVAGFVLSALALTRLRLTGFAWTTAALGTGTYLGVLLVFGWLDKEPEAMALWCLPLVAAEGVALACERTSRPRWAMPFHLIALLALVGALDTMAMEGPTLQMVGFDRWLPAYLDHDRQVALSFAGNGLVFFALMLVTERASSLDLRRMSRALEILALPHTLVALYLNASAHRGDPHVLADVALYLSAVCVLLIIGPWRSRWRILLGALGGVAFGCHLLVDLELVPKAPFILGLGGFALAAAIATYAWLVLSPRRQRGTSSSPPAAPST